MDQIFWGEHRKDMKYSCKIKVVHVRKSKISPLLKHEVKITEIMTIIVSLIILYIANIFHSALKEPFLSFEGELHFSLSASLHCIPE